MKTRIFLILFIITFLSFPLFSFAYQAGKSTDYGLSITANQGDAKKAFNPSSMGSPRDYLVERLGGITGSIISFVGLVFLILIIYSGFLWMTASGNDQQVEKSRKIMIWSVIGIFAVFASFAFVQFLGTQLTKQTIPETPSFELDIDNSGVGIGDDYDIFEGEDEFFYDPAEAFMTCLGDSYDFEKHEKCLCIVYGGDGCSDILGSSCSDCDTVFGFSLQNAYFCKCTCKREIMAAICQP